MGRTAVRPAVVTLIAGAELAAAMWDSRIFLRLHELFPSSWGDGFSFGILLPALMAISAIYAGVGLLQMRRGAWQVWMLRHAWLGLLYVLAMPGLLAHTMFDPSLSLIVSWRFMIIVTSLLAGGYLYAIRERFDNGSAR